MKFKKQMQLRFKLMKFSLFDINLFRLFFFLIFICVSSRWFLKIPLNCFHDKKPRFLSEIQLKAKVLKSEKCLIIEISRFI